MASLAIIAYNTTLAPSLVSFIRIYQLGRGNISSGVECRQNRSRMKCSAPFLGSVVAKSSNTREDETKAEDLCRKNMSYDQKRCTNNKETQIIVKTFCVSSKWLSSVVFQKYLSSYLRVAHFFATSLTCYPTATLSTFDFAEICRRKTLFAKIEKAAKLSARSSHPLVVMGKKLMAKWDAIVCTPPALNPNAQHSPLCKMVAKGGVGNEGCVDR